MSPRATPFVKDWEGLTAYVVGNGPSMLDADAFLWLAERHEKGAKVLVANGGYKLFPFADALMCSDRHWLAANTTEPDSLAAFRGRDIIVTRPEAVVRWDIRMKVVRRAFIEKVHGDIFADPGRLVEGHNSTSTNISMAVLRGAKRIVLLGIDLAPGPDLRRRTYDESKDDPKAAAARYARQAFHITMQSEHVKRRGVEVLNASPRSVLACYPYVKPEELE